MTVVDWCFLFLQVVVVYKRDIWRWHKLYTSLLYLHEIRSKLCTKTKIVYLLIINILGFACMSIAYICRLVTRIWVQYNAKIFIQNCCYHMMMTFYIFLNFLYVLLFICLFIYSKRLQIKLLYISRIVIYFLFIF